MYNVYLAYSVYSVYIVYNVHSLYSVNNGYSAYCYGAIKNSSLWTLCTVWKQLWLNPRGSVEKLSPKGECQVCQHYAKGQCEGLQGTFQGQTQGWKTKGAQPSTFFSREFALGIS